MHTSAFKSCRIHHNGGYDGDVIITNMDDTSKPVGKKTEIRSTFRKLVKTYKLNEATRAGRSHSRIELQDIKTSNHILIEFGDLEAFIDCALIDAITCKMESGLDRTGHKKLMSMANILNINLEHLEED